MLTPESIFFLTILGVVAFGIVNLVFAVGVFMDAARFSEDSECSTELVPGPMWALATLLGGVFVATAYWIIHHSTLSRGERGIRL